jgi:hypothetical protein
MLKIKTIAQILIILVSAFCLAAEESSTPSKRDSSGYPFQAQTSDHAFASYEADLKKYNCASTDPEPGDHVTEGNPSYCKKVRQKLEGVIHNSGAGNCDALDEKVRDAKGDFIGACGAIGLPTGLQECANKRFECKCLNSGADHSGLDCSDMKSEGSKSSGLNVNAAANQMRYCPERAKDPDQLQKDLDKAEEKLDKLKDKIPDLQDKVNDVGKDLRKTQAEVAKQSLEHQKEFSAALKKAKEGKDQKEQALIDKMGQIQSQIAQVDEQITQFDLAITDAAMKREETKTQIDLNCHATASATVSKLQSEALDAARRGVYNRGGMTAMMKNVGLSDRDSWQRVADKYYRWCLASKPTLASKESANRIFDAAKRQAEVAKTNAQKRRDLLVAQLNRVKDPNGQCGNTVTQADGGSGITEMCKASQQAQDDMKQAVQDLQAAQQADAIQLQAAQQDAAGNFGKQMQLMQTQMDAANEQGRVDKMRSLIDMQANQGGSSDKESRAKLSSSFGKWEGAAEQYLFNCCENRSARRSCAGTATDWDVAHNQTLQPKARSNSADDFFNFTAGPQAASSSGAASGSGKDMGDSDDKRGGGVREGTTPPGAEHE